MWVHELKGSGDLDPLERVSHRFVSGIDDEAIGYAAESLRLLRAEIGRRTERLRALPRELCPDKRVTREIAAGGPEAVADRVRRSTRRRTCSATREYGKAAAEDAEFIIKIGPAFGDRADPGHAAAGQGSAADRGVRQRRPAVLPEGHGPGRERHDPRHRRRTRTGSGPRRSGRRSTPGIGYLVGAAAGPQVVRTYYLDMPAAERVAKRARPLREAAGHAVRRRARPGRRRRARRPGRRRRGVRRRHRPAVGRGRRPARRSGSPTGGTARPARHCRPTRAASACASVSVRHGGRTAKGARLADVQAAAGKP